MARGAADLHGAQRYEKLGGRDGVAVTRLPSICPTQGEQFRTASIIGSGDRQVRERFVAALAQPSRGKVFVWGWAERVGELAKASSEEMQATPSGAGSRGALVVRQIQARLPKRRPTRAWAFLCRRPSYSAATVCSSASTLISLSARSVSLSSVSFSSSRVSPKSLAASFIPSFSAQALSVP